MFQSLRANNQVYILHRDGKPTLERGTVVSVTAPVPKYPLPQNFGHAPELVVDVVVKVNDQNITYKQLPANADIADFGSNGLHQVISTSRDAMNAEVSSMKQRSIDIINSVQFNQDVINGCDVILQMLNPEFAEKQQQQAEINGLKTQMTEMSRALSDLTSLIAGLKEERRTSSSKKDKDYENN
jgi:hypothetical protein